MENTFKNVESAMHAARKNGDKFAVTVLSTLLGEMQNKIPKNATEAQQHEQAGAIVKKFIEGVKETLKVANLPSSIRLKAELAILEAFMPKQLTEDELKHVVWSIFAESGPNKGAIMKNLKQHYAGMYDGKNAAELADHWINQ